MPHDTGADAARSIVLMRHGETAWNRERRIMGNLDVPLSEAGRQQCVQAARMLAAFEIDRIVSSPLTRARESAEIIAAELAIDVGFDADIEEVRFGRWQGKTYREILDDPAFSTFMSNPIEQPTPGGETILDVQKRGLQGFGRSAPDEHVLFVSHGDIIRTAVCHFLRLPIAEFRRVRIDNCGTTAVTERAGQIEVRFVNLLADPQRAWHAPHWGGAA